MTLPKLVLVLLICIATTALGAEPKSKPKKPAPTSSSGKKTDAAADKSAVSEEAEKIAKELTDAQSGKLLEILNKGDDQALMALPGVGKVRAAAIKKARPVKTVAAATLVEGVGEGALKEWVKHAKAGFPVKGAEKKAETTAKKKTKAKEK